MLDSPNLAWSFLHFLLRSSLFQMLILVEYYIHLYNIFQSGCIINTVGFAPKIDRRVSYCGVRSTVPLLSGCQAAIYRHIVCTCHVSFYISTLPQSKWTIGLMPLYIVYTEIPNLINADWKQIKWSLPKALGIAQYFISSNPKVLNTYVLYPYMYI